MRINNGRIRRRVWVTTGCVVVAVASWWFWTRAQEGEGSAAVKPQDAFVRLAGAGANAGERELQERAEYFDPTPLFFPTEHNFGQSQPPESSRRQPSQVFASYEAKMRFAENSLTAYGQETVVAPERLADVLAQGNEAPFAGYGLLDDARPALAERSAFMEIKTLSDGKTIVAQALQQLVLPRTDFAPLEFLVLVESAGIIGPPVLMVSSDREDVDGFFRDYLVKAYRLGERMSPGRYRVVVGP